MRRCPECGSPMKEVANLPVRVPTRTGKSWRKRNIHRFKCSCGHEESDTVRDQEHDAEERNLKAEEKKSRKNPDNE